MLLIGKPSISMDHLYHGYVSHNQRVDGWIDSWVNYSDLTVLPHYNIFSKGNHPKMAQQFRVVKYDNLPTWIDG